MMHQELVFISLLAACYTMAEANAGAARYDFTISIKCQLLNPTEQLTREMYLCYRVIYLFVKVGLFGLRVYNL